MTDLQKIDNMIIEIDDMLLSKNHNQTEFRLTFTYDQLKLLKHVLVVYTVKDSADQEIANSIRKAVQKADEDRRQFIMKASAEIAGHMTQADYNNGFDWSIKGIAESSVSQAIELYNQLMKKI